MEISPTLLWNLVLTLVIAPLGYYLSQMSKELQRVQILLNQTREDYLKRAEHSEETDRVLEHLRRLEDKVDRLIERHGTK
ncbi:MAG: hypothetical protein VW683_03970 [Betaproteobacteria bacterium]